MIVVVDSGIWISGFVFGGTPLEALRHAYISHQIAVCDKVLTEVRSALLRKFHWNADRIEGAVADYLDNTICFTTTGIIRGVCRAPTTTWCLNAPSCPRQK